MAKRRHTENIIVPPDLEKRKLPALPISKRKLPSLNQSRSVSARYTKPPCRINIRAGKLSVGRSPSSSSRSLTPIIKRSRSASIKLRQSVKNLFSNSRNNLHRNSNHKKDKSEHKENTQSPWFSMKKAKSMPAPDESKLNQTTSNRSSQRSSIKWHPSLRHIYDDKELLSALTVFMTRQYNEENILFLLSIRALNKTQNETQINARIRDIYSEYILHDAPKQVNLSYDCFMNVLSLRDSFIQMDVTRKKAIFDFCVLEIEKLILTSILHGFYLSNEFRIVAESRPFPLVEVPTPIDVDVAMNESYLSISTTTSSTSYSIDEFETRTPIGEHWDDLGPSPVFDITEDKYIASSNAFDTGYHEWSVKIIKCDSFRQEIGVVSNMNPNIQTKTNGGICGTPEFCARAVYGYHKEKSGSFYYTAFNANNSLRINKNLSSLHIHPHEWRAGDVIKVCLNLDKGNIKFYYNGQKVRRTISVQRNVMYYPIVCYEGHCEYKVL
eukprot:130822_1